MMPTTTTPKHSFHPLRERLQTELLASYPELIERLGWSRAQIEAHQRRQLRELVAHAQEHSPFHARRLRGVDPASLDPRDLSRLPVMTKSQMMDELDDVFTDRRLTRRAVEESLAEAGAEPATPVEGHLALVSGGSSGRRGVFVLDEVAGVQFFGSLSRGIVARLEAMGEPPPGGLPIAMVAAASPIHATGVAAPLTDDHGGGGLPFRFLRVPVTQPLPEIVDQLNALRAPALYGYPTMLAQLAREQLAGRLQISPVVVTCTSESLTPDLRSAISAGFGAPVIDSFGSTEGLVGASGPDDEAITFAEDGCIVELVDEQHRPVAPGTPSASVLVTNLSNRVQPLIRYELADSFVQQPEAAAHGHLRARVDGRSDDDFAYDGVAIHPLVVRSVLVRSAQVLEYQVRQTATGIDVSVVTEPAADLGPLAEQLRTALGAAGLTDPHVTVDPTPTLDRDAATGKLRRFVPLG
jgi:phenylacetate-coenzyme A ligase PaaK-like adenylate-forming protein